MTQLEAQQAETQDERANLLYVALTRARQIFAVSGVEGDGDWYGAVAEHTQCWEPPHA
jgi:ATP-dependent exoDNAse (exonuclease V) beta subunit